MAVSGEGRVGVGARERGGAAETQRVGKGASGRGGEAIKEIAPKSSNLLPTDKVIIAYLLVIASLVVIFSNRIELWTWFLVLHAVLLALVVLIAIIPSPRPLTPSPSRPLALSPSRPFAFLLRGWYPVLLIPITYKELTYLIPRIHPRDFDEALAAIDYRMFGVHPTVWLERIMSPPLTELLQLTYSTYYFLPVILGCVLWRKAQFDRFHFLVFVLVLGFYLSYLGYISVPVIGPRFLPSIMEAQTKPLTGLLFYQTVRDMLDRAEGITRDCFPSGHTELTLLVLYYSAKFHRKTFWCLLPLGAGIVFSTVYLRYHYVIDIIAGALLAAIIVLVARPLYNALLGKMAGRS